MLLLHQDEPWPSIVPEPSSVRFATFVNWSQAFDDGHSFHASTVLGATTFPRTYSPDPI